VDAAIIFSDILVIPRAFGMEIEFIEKKGPVFDKTVRTSAEIKNMSSKAADNLDYVYKALSLTFKNLNGRVPLIGFCGSPWTVSTYMFEGKSTKTFDVTRRLIKENPALVHQLLEKIAIVSIDYLKQQAEAGAQALQIFDSWGGRLSHEEYGEFSLPYITQILDGIKDVQVPKIVFGLGLSASLDKLADCGADVLGVDSSITIGEAQSIVNGRVSLQGNLNPQVLYEKPDSIKNKVFEIINDYGNKPGHIFNLGHGLAPDMPVENVQAAVDAVKEISFS